MLKSSGVGVERNRAAAITVEVENELWSKGLLGTHSPKALLTAVFFLMVKLPSERSARALQFDFRSAEKARQP